MYVVHNLCSLHTFHQFRHRSLCCNGVLRNFNVRPTEAASRSPNLLHHDEAVKLLGVVSGGELGGCGISEVGVHVFFLRQS